jgi:flagellar basal-body rod protein FlgC
MGFYSALEISASGMSAERLAMDVIANNIANVNTTRTPQGGAFKRQLVVFSQAPGAPDSTSPLDAMDEAGDSGDDSLDLGNPFSPEKSSRATVEGVQVVGIANDPGPDRMVFDPGNPDADARGYVHYPNVQVVKEMVDMMAASRAYEADVAAIQASRSMSNNALGLLHS